MRETWKRPSTPADGQPTQTYKPKLLLKSPSMRAITNYNNLSIDSPTKNNYDNLNFIPENGDLQYDEAYSSTVNSKTSIYPNYGVYDYPTLGSTRTTSNTGSELGSDKNEMGSTTKLVSPKFMSYQTCFTHLQTVLCTTSLAAGFGNLFRLPQTALVRGGFPFLVAYVVLTILIGLPLVFLELGIGQLAQEGFIKSWRAVPFFRGVGYVKLIAGCLLSIYYPLYMGLALYYIIWMAQGRVPFKECSKIRINETTGYSAEGIDGQDCLKNTFLESPFKDPFWYGIFAAILFVIWTVVIVLSIRRTKSFIRSLCILLFPVVGCLVFLTVRSVYVEHDQGTLEDLAEHTDWSILSDASVWYYAAIQVFFSTYVGFGSFVTNAGIIYNKVNPLWTALGYIIVNLLFGVGSVIITYVLLYNLKTIPPVEGHSELYLITAIYTAVIKDGNPNEARVGAFIAYAVIVLSGFISMATITYTLLKAITVENRRRLKWWQTSIVLSFSGFVLGCAILLKENFQLVRLLDHYIVGNLILISAVVEVFALIAFYGTERIKSDFEFMLGHILSNIWLILWWLLPLLLTGIFAWALITLPREDIFNKDPEWLYGTGWGFVLAATIFIFIIGLVTASRQDGYTFLERFKTSLKPSHNWGPKDPMQRHTWVQWNSKAKQGERDFTLKRKGTRDYTRSIKKNAKKAASESNSTLNRPSNASSDYVEPYYVQHTLRVENEHPKAMRVTSLIDSMDRAPLYFRETYGGSTNLNPLAKAYETEDGSEESGTYRRGPYIIPDGNIVHVCHRRFSQSEDATEL